MAKIYRQSRFDHNQCFLTSDFRTTAGIHHSNNILRGPQTNICAGIRPVERIPSHKCCTPSRFICSTWMYIASIYCSFVSLLWLDLLCRYPKCLCNSEISTLFGKSSYFKILFTRYTLFVTLRIELNKYSFLKLKST